MAGFVSGIAKLAACNTSLVARPGPDPLMRGLTYHRLIRGINNCHAHQTPVHAAPVTVEHLTTMWRHIRLSCFDDLRDWCAITLAFFGCLRVDEYTNGNLRHEHVRLIDGGVELVLVTSKCNLLPARVTLASRSDFLCPTLALVRYRSMLSQYHGLPQGDGAPLLIARGTPTSYHALADEEFTARLRRRLAEAVPGIDVSRYSGHSFRRGGATALAKAGVPDSAIQLHGRWKSNAFLRYIAMPDDDQLRLQTTQAIPASIPANPAQPAPRQ